MLDIYLNHSSTFLFVYFGTHLSLNLELTSLATLAGQQAGGCSCLLSPWQGYRHTLPCLAFTWVLETRTQVCVLAVQASYLLNHLPSHSHTF